MAITAESGVDRSTRGILPTRPAMVDRNLVAPSILAVLTSASLPTAVTPIAPRVAGNTLRSRAAQRVFIFPDRGRRDIFARLQTKRAAGRTAILPAALNLTTVHAAARSSQS